MSASLDTIVGHLERIERALTEQTAQPVRSLSVDAVVALTGIPRRAVLAAIRSGDLPSIAAGERTRVVRPADLDDWLAHLASRS